MKIIINKKYKLVFNGHYLKLFKIINGVGKEINRWEALSGQPNYKGYWETGKSPIPPSSEINDEYGVVSKVVYFDYIYGLGTWVFDILPDPVFSKDKKSNRQYLRIHSDDNEEEYPGSAGCIAIKKSESNNFKSIMEAIYKQEGYCLIPLTVQYVANVGVITPIGNDTTGNTIFDKALAFTLKWEGGYVNNPNDYGGATNKGVTQNTYDSWRESKGFKAQSVKNITDSEVKDIYYNNYWLASKCDRMIDSLAIVMFDTSVNFGVKNGITFFQEALGLPMDGIWGSKTEEVFSKNNTKELAKEIVDCRIAYRKQRVKEDPSQGVFLQGWLNRDNDLMKLVSGVNSVITELTENDKKMLFETIDKLLKMGYNMDMIMKAIEGKE